jgi:LytS/YehU family sensor histidine kinase
MNPHFMFNSLNSIKNFILRQETKEASHYLTRFSQLMRVILRNSSQPLIPLADEMEALRLYIELELMRFDGGFEVNIDVEEAIDQHNLLIPPMLIQPYVENAIWHGLMHKSVPRTLAILVHCDAQNLKIHIVDNGIGREQAAVMNSKQRNNHKSYGMQITHDRLSLIERSLSIRTRVDIHDRMDPDGQPAGTEVELTIPLLTQFETALSRN